MQLGLNKSLLAAEVIDWWQSYMGRGVAQYIVASEQACPKYVCVCDCIRLVTITLKRMN